MTKGSAALQITASCVGPGHRAPLWGVGDTLLPAEQLSHKLGGTVKLAHVSQQLCGTGHLVARWWAQVGDGWLLNA